MSNLKITRNSNMYIKIKSIDGGYIESQSVEANLLYEILIELRKGNPSTISI